MTAHSPIVAAPADKVFPESARVAFTAAYPDSPTKLTHGLAGHPLLTLDALAQLAERMPLAQVEYNLGISPSASARRTPPPTA